VWGGPRSLPPSSDVRRLALPEGVIEPGGSVSGFLYFQNAAARAERLELSWHVRTPAGGHVARLRVAFVIEPLR
jgi:hypothetical protein